MLSSRVSVSVKHWSLSRISNARYHMSETSCVVTFAMMVSWMRELIAKTNVTCVFRRYREDNRLTVFGYQIIINSNKSRWNHKRWFGV